MRRLQYPLLGAFLLTVPWVIVWVGTSVLPWLASRVLTGISYTVPGGLGTISTVGTVGISGLSILGAAFLLAWAAETAEKDVPPAFAIAVLAVLAVAPEYAVDALYAWNAGVFAGTPRGIEAGNLAIANMTGANRILIGIGWAGIALFTVFRPGSDRDPNVIRRDGFLADAVSIDRDISLEVVFLLAATIWAFAVPLNGGIDIVDMLVLVGLYVAYILIIIRGEVEPVTAHVGVPAYLQSFPKRTRVLTVVTLFAFSGLMIVTAVEPFAHGLEQIGVDIGVPPFFMIQWIAPLASEAPELIVVLYLVNKARSTAGFNTLISSKLNQWTLLIGTLVIVHSLALGRYGVLGFDAKQAAEIWLTAAQSFFAVSILVNFEISVREAVTLLVLFLSQVGIEFLIIRGVFEVGITDQQFLIGYSILYLLLGVWLFVRRRRAAVALVRQTRNRISSGLSSGSFRFD